VARRICNLPLLHWRLVIANYPFEASEDARGVNTGCGSGTRVGIVPSPCHEPALP